MVGIGSQDMEYVFIRSNGNIRLGKQTNFAVIPALGGTGVDELIKNCTVRHIATETLYEFTETRSRAINWKRSGLTFVVEKILFPTPGRNDADGPVVPFDTGGDVWPWQIPDAHDFSAGQTGNYGYPRGGLFATLYAKLSGGDININPLGKI